MKNKKTTLISTILAALSLGLSVIAIIFALVAHTNLQDTRKDVFIMNTQSHYEISKLSFCVIHEIPQCDDANITDWNNSHPEKAFTLKSFQQLTEDGIAEYETSRQ